MIGSNAGQFVSDACSAALMLTVLLGPVWFVQWHDRRMDRWQRRQVRRGRP